MKELEATHAEKWYGTHRGVTYEVAHHAVSAYKPQGIWCGYLCFNSRRNKEILTLRGKSVEPDGLISWERDRANDFWNTLDFHGGITFYEERISPLGTVCMKIGCDYAHYGDDEIMYDLEHVAEDMKRIINQYREVYPE